MTRVIAKLALAVIAVGLMFGNYWFTFGLWPRSWGAFFFFAISTIAVAALSAAIDLDARQ